MSLNFQGHFYLQFFLSNSISPTYFLGAISRSPHSLFSFSKKMSSNKAAIGARVLVINRNFDESK